MDEPVMAATSRAWMAGELPSADYFAMVRREARWDRWAPRGWRRLRLWTARSVQRG